MKYLILFSLILFAGCSTVAPLKPKFPDLPPELTKNCEPLNKVEGEKVLITELHKVVIANYTKYHECAIKVEGWQIWYKEQKKIYESVK